MNECYFPSVRGGGLISLFDQLGVYSSVTCTREFVFHCVDKDASSGNEFQLLVFLLLSIHTLERLPYRDCTMRNFC